MQQVNKIDSAVEGKSISIVVDIQHTLSLPVCTVSKLGVLPLPCWAGRTSAKHAAEA